MNIWRRAISMLLAVVLLVQMLPAGAIAAEIESMTEEPAAETVSREENFTQEVEAVTVTEEAEERKEPASDPLTETEAPEISADISADPPRLLTVAEDFAWTLTDGVLTITGNGDMPEWDIGSAPWSADIANITQVCIEDGITSISRYAFHSEYTPISSVTMADSVTFIDEYAFYNCSSLTDLKLSANLVSMGQACFGNCESLEAVVLPEGLTEIPDSAFARCYALKSVTLPESLTNINGSAFLGTALTEVSIPEGVTTIGWHAFSGCTALVSVELPDTLQDLGGSAFYGCAALTQIQIPEGITSIYSSTFYGCSALAQINLPSSLQSIGGSAFYECTSLTELDLPEGLTYMGSKAFAFCTGITSVEMPSTMTYEEYTDSDLFWKSGVQRAVFREGSKTVGGFYGCTPLTEVVLPDGVEVIEDYAFKHCTNLASIEIPASVTDIRWSAFNNCTSLTAVVLPENLTFLDQGAFAACSALTSVEFPAGLTGVGYSAFSGCSSLVSVSLPESLKTIDGHAFSSCTALEQVIMPDSVTSIGMYAFQGCTALARVNMPASLTSIGTRCFSNSGVTSLEFSSGLTSIGEKAFYNCTNLTTVTFPDTLTSIGEEAFYECTALASVELPGSLQTVGLSAFYKCTALTEVILNEGIQEMVGYAFAYCTALKTVTIPASLTDYGYAFCGSGLESVVIAEGQTLVSDYAFFNCTALTQVTMPSTITTIDRNAFGSCSGLTQIQWPESLTTIKSNAFENCTGLTKVEIPGGVTLEGGIFSGCTSLTDVTIADGEYALGNNMFYNCTSLCNVNLGSGLTGIGNYAFQGCTALTQITLPDSVTTLGSYAFRNCSKLENVQLPENLTSIGDYAFYGCTALASMEIPANVSTIGASAFYGCTALAELTISEGVTSIGNSAFQKCTALTQVQLPDSLTSLGTSAFRECTKLESVGFSVNLTTINSSAFYGCTALASIEIPANVSTIGDYAFYGCTALAELTISEGVTSIGNSVFQSCTALTQVVLPESVTNLGAYAFRYCSKLENVQLPANLPTINSSTFSECTALASVEIPAGVSTIGYNAFYGCTALAELTISEGVTSIGNSAFENCTALTQVVLPESVTNLGTYAFRYCSKLENVHLPESMASLPNGVFYGCAALQNMELGSSIMSIGSNAFQNCTSLVKIEIPAGVTGIADNTFNGCTALTEVTLPESVTSIGRYAFSRCSALTQMVLPESLTSIGDNAFNGCSALTQIVLPDSVTSLGIAAFRDCGNLTTVHLSDGLTAIPNTVFYNCVGLKEVLISGSITAIDSYAFSGCSGLTTMVIPNGVTSIGSYAFQNCSALTRVDIPESVTSIGNNAFYGCSALTIYTFVSAYAWQYAVDNNIPVVNILNSAAITLSVVDETGTALTEGFTVQWYATDSEEILATGQTLNGVNADEIAYDYLVVLDEERSCQYQQPQRTAVVIEGNNYNLVCTLEPLAEITVFGSVSSADGVPLTGAQIKFTQTFAEQYTREIPATVNADGTFSAQLRAVPTTAEFLSSGYYTRTVPANLETAEQTYAMGAITLTALPSNKITLSLLRVFSAKAGETAAMEPIMDAGELAFAVRNVSRNTDITDFTVQLPYLILGADQADAGETIQITISDPSGELETAMVSLTLNENKMGQVEAQMLSNGAFAVESLSGCEEAALMVFDANGKLVLSDSVQAGYESRELSSGSYQVVFLQKTGLLRSASNLSILAELGLRAGTDYTVKTVNIQRGIVSVLDSVSVPALDESRLSYTVEENTSYTANDYILYPGEYTMIRLSYELESGHNARNQKLQIELPDGLQIMEGSVSLDSKTYAYTVQNQILEITTGTDQGVLRLYCSSLEAGEWESTAYLLFEENGSVIRQPLGTLRYTVTPGTLEVMERVGSTSIPVRGVTIPYAPVTVYDNGTVVATTTANAVGSWSTMIDLVESYAYSFHEIYAEIEMEELGQTYRTESKYVVYEQGLVELSNVTMYNTADNGMCVTVFNFRNPGAIPSYRCWPGRYPKFTFHVNFTGDSRTAVKNVYVITKDSDGDVRHIPCHFDEIAETWLGTASFEYSNDVPVMVGASFERVEQEPDTVEPIIDQDRIDDITSAIQEAEAEIEEELASIEEPDASVYEDMSFEELDAVIDELADGMDQLLAEMDYEFDTCMRDLSVTSSEVEGGVVAGFEELGAEVKVETDVTIDEEALLNSGYEKIGTSSGGYIFRYATESVVIIVDPVEKTRMTTNLTSMEVASDAGMTVFAAQNGELLMSSAGDVFKQLMEVLNTAQKILGQLDDAFEKYTNGLDKIEEKLLNKQIKLMEEFKKLNAAMAERAKDLSFYENPDLTQEDLDKDTAKHIEDMKKADRLSGKIVRYQKLLKGIEAARIALKRLPIVGLAFDVAQFIEYAMKIWTLYKNLPETCPADQEELEQIRWDILGLAGYMTIHVGSSVLMNVASLMTTVAGGMVLAPASFGASLAAAIGVAVVTIGVTLAADIVAMRYVERKYNELLERIKFLQCEDKPPVQPVNPSWRQEAKPIIDPSGYVYEAVPSNRVEGVKAEIYERVGDTDVLWNAEDYEQVNPVYTDSVGHYRWDVPFGQWLVKFSKDGYYDTDSSDDPAANADGYLPVPPPQMEVNTAIVSKAAPTVESVNVYQDQIQILFSQYMQPETVTADSVQITSNGAAVSGTITAANLEENYDGTDSYSSIFFFTPDQDLSGSATVSIQGAVNYADTAMAQGYTATQNVTIRPEEISLADSLQVAYGGQKTLELWILPAEAGAGRTLTVSAFVPEIAGVVNETITADAGGKAAVTLSGNMPGDAAITVKLNGTDLEASCDVSVVTQLEETAACEKVEASIPSGSVVEAGTALTLHTPTEGAQIYYTLDGTCPCVVDSPSRLKYTGPIIIREDMFLIAYAVKEGLADSATAGFVYTVRTECTHSFGSWEETKAPTGSAAGEETRTCSLCGFQEKRTVAKLSNPFTDVKSKDYYYDPVLWAVRKGVTNGYGSNTTFCPDVACSRGQIVTFLWRAAGEPEPTSSANPFTDVKSSDYYHKAVLWAVEKGITNGYGSNTTFCPDVNCTRGQVATFLYRYFDTPAISSGSNPFVDVAGNAYYRDAVLWAVEQEITNGYGSSNTFCPDLDCSRGQIVTFLYRAMN